MRMLGRCLLGWICGLACYPLSGLAGGACVVAKVQGDAQAVAWAVGATLTVETATLQAREALTAAGHGGPRQRFLFPQAATTIDHGHLVVVKAVYQTLRDRQRTSYGCGFSRRDAATAERFAVHDLSNYDWGWKADQHGYEIHHSESF